MEGGAATCALPVANTRRGERGGDLVLKHDSRNNLSEIDLRAMFPVLLIPGRFPPCSERLLTGIAFLIRGEDVRLNLEAFLEERCSVSVSGQGREHSPGHNRPCPPTLRQGPATSLEVEEGQRLPSLPGLPRSVGP